MARSPALNGLIVVVVAALVAGVAWFKSQRETGAPPVEPAVVAPDRVTPPSPPQRDPEQSKPKLAPEPRPAEPLRPDTPPPAKEDRTTAAERDTEPVLPPESSATDPARENKSRLGQPSDTAPTTSASDDDSATTQPQAVNMPRVVDLGADKCKACKELAPILEELKKEYAGRAVVEFIDVWKNPKAANPYKIRLIPTQIFYDRNGKEVWRHEGFLPKKDFVAKLAELGVK